MNPYGPVLILAIIGLAAIAERITAAVGFPPEAEVGICTFCKLLSAFTRLRLGFKFIEIKGHVSPFRGEAESMAFQTGPM